VLTKHEKSHELKAETLEEETDIEKAETILVEGIDYEESDVRDATEILLQKEFPEVEDIEETTIEQEIIEEDEDFCFMQSHDLHTESLAMEPIIEEVVETEAITLATSDGQVVRVISRDQYDKLIQAANKNKTYKCATCNRTFASNPTYQAHFKEPWEKGGCLSMSTK